MKELHLSLPPSAHSLIPPSIVDVVVVAQLQTRKLKNRHNAHTILAFSPFFFVHIMAFKWKLKDFLLLRLESEFSAGLLWMKRKEGGRRSKRMLKIITGSSLLHTQYLLIFLKERFLWKLINHPCKCFLNELVNTMKLFFWHSLKFFSLKFFSSFTLKTLFFCGYNFRIINNLRWFFVCHKNVISRLSHGNRMRLHF